MERTERRLVVAPGLHARMAVGSEPGTKPGGLAEQHVTPCPFLSHPFPYPSLPCQPTPPCFVCEPGRGPRGVMMDRVHHLLPQKEPFPVYRETHREDGRGKATSTETSIDTAGQVAVHEPCLRHLRIGNCAG